MRALGGHHARVIHQNIAFEILGGQIIQVATGKILSEHTGQTVEKISTDTDRDFVMTAQQAKEYGIIDEVIDTRNVVDTSGAIKAID